MPSDCRALSEGDQAGVVIGSKEKEVKWSIFPGEYRGLYRPHDRGICSRCRHYLIKRRRDGDAAESSAEQRVLGEALPAANNKQASQGQTKAPVLIRQGAANHWQWAFVKNTDFRLELPHAVIGFSEHGLVIVVEAKYTLKYMLPKVQDNPIQR